MLNYTAGNSQHAYVERQQDCYETPPEAVHALLKVEHLPRDIWEPACGSGHISKVLLAAGYDVVSSDLHDYEFGKAGIDFLSGGFIPMHGAIVTNPPYQLATQFVATALELCPKVVMLLRLAFLEAGTSKTAVGRMRTRVLEYSGLARIHVFRNRLPMMHRRGWNGPKASSAIPFAWFVWERGYQDPTTIDRISWERA